MDTRITLVGLGVGIVLGVVLYVKVGGFKKLMDETVLKLPIPSV